VCVCVCASRILRVCFTNLVMDSDEVVMYIQYC